MMPPSAKVVVVVRGLATSLARTSTTLAVSSGCARRTRGMAWGNHLLDSTFGGEQHFPQVDVDHLVVIVGSDIEAGGAGLSAGLVHHHVPSSLCRPCGCNQPQGIV